MATGSDLFIDKLSKLFLTFSNFWCNSLKLKGFLFGASRKILSEDSTLFFINSYIFIFIISRIKVFNDLLIPTYYYILYNG